MNAFTPAPLRIENPFDLLSGPTHWATDNWPAILFAAISGIVIFAVLEGLRWLSIALAKRIAKTPRGYAFIILRRTLQKTSHIFLALAAAKIAAGYNDPAPHVLQTITFLFTVAAVLQAVRWLRAVIFGIIDIQADPEHGANEALANAGALIRTLVNATLFIIAIIVILDNLGVNVTGLVAGLGIGGIAIGLAAQGIFSDLFASLSIIFDRPFRVGETIDFGKGSAVVERIGLKSTRLRAITGERFIVSNAQLLGKEIASFAGMDHRRFTLSFGLIYQTEPEDAARVPDVVREVIESQGAHFLRAGFIAFGPSSLDYEALFDIMTGDADAIATARHKIGIALFTRFKAEGFSFAYPTQTTMTADPDGKMIMPYPPISQH